MKAIATSLGCGRQPYAPLHKRLTAKLREAHGAWRDCAQARAGPGAREPNRSLPSPVLKPFLILTTLAATLALMVSAAPASAKTPCWKNVIGDWYVDGRVDGTYPIPCYQQAIQNLPDDVRSYADAASEIRRAMLDRLRHGD